MKQSSLRAFVAAVLVLLAIVAAPGSAAQQAASEPAVHIVVLDGPPLAAYGGGIAGLAATDPTVTGADRLDARSAASRAYLAHLAAVQDDMLTRVSSAIGRSVEAIHRYDAALNGFSVKLTATEAQQVAALSGVAQVVVDRNLELTTDVGPAWIGAPSIWGGTHTAGAPGTRGEGIVVGVVDTGVNHDHPSFADPAPGDGYAYSSYAAPAGPGYRGACDPVTGAPFCNDKLIGVYDFTGTSPIDDNGHGSHTASTAAGNVVDAKIVAPTTTLERRISGVAPHARVISYKGCVTTPVRGTCPPSATVAGINQATLDGVDVINFSIGGASRDPWTDPNAIAFLNARRAGIFLAVSAGNDGPGAGTVGSPSDSPWVTSVAASTHNRIFSSSLVDITGGATTQPSIRGKAISIGYGPAKIVYAGDYGNALCGSGTAEVALNPFPPGTFNGEIVVCDRGTFGRVQKGQFVKEAGAGGMVLANDSLSGDSLVGDTHALPATHITYKDGVKLKEWLKQGSGHMGRITGLVTDESPANGDQMASFSSRGPNPSVPGVIKPDVTAPGVDILAAFHTPAGSVGGAPEFNAISGTSMSGPHTAGAAALVRAVHPDWTPDEVRSALTTTGFNSLPGEGTEAHGMLKEDATRPADPFDLGGGRVELRKAVQAGLVLDVSPDAYFDANPALGGDPTTLNLATLGNGSCVGTCSWTRVVKSTAAGAVTWSATASPANTALGLTVSPASFTLQPGGTQTITVTANVSKLGAAWAFGRVTLDSADVNVPDAALPVAVRRGGEIPVAPGNRLTLHMHGNADPLNGADHESGHAEEGFCTGDGKADLAFCSGPYLLKSSELSPSPAASWKGGLAEWGLGGAHDRTIYDPTWVWCLRADDPAVTTETQCPVVEKPAQGTTTIEGPLTIEWWAQCAATCTVTPTSWKVDVWTDGVNVVKDQQVQAGVAPTGIPTKLEATVNVPRTTANHRITVTLEPWFGVDAGVEFSILYDSTQPCAPTAASGPCDSVVHMPVVSTTPNRAPDAVDDTATVERGAAVVVPVVANDTDADGDAVEVTAVTNGSSGSVTENADGSLTYTQDGGPTASDSFTYTVSDGRGGSDTATVAVTVTGPDLVITDLVATEGRGDRTKVTASVRNAGTSAAPATATEFVLDGTTVIGTAATPALAAGETANVTVEWITEGVKGEHRITATADKGAAAAETDESNNSASRTVTVKGNKVQNGSFEQSSSGTAPDNWTSSGETSYQQGGSDGDKSVSAGPSGSWQSDPVAIQPGNGYAFSVDVTGAAGVATIEQLSATGTVLASLPLLFAASPVGTYATVAAALTAVEGAAQMRVRLAGSLTGAATFDNVRLSQQ